MKADLKRIIRFRSSISVALIFWCAGAGCMLVSYAHGAMIAPNVAPQFTDQVMSSASGSMNAHACCKAKHKSAKQNLDATSAARGTNSNSDDAELGQVTLPATPAPSGTMSCCPLTSGSIVAASRSQSNESASALAENSSSSLALTNSAPAPVAVPLRLPNRAQSYLLDCVFLI